MLGASAPGDGDELLPDLDPRPPAELTVTSARGHYRLGFSASVDNLGAGPLVVVASRVAAASTMTADQLVRTQAGTRRYSAVGSLLYVPRGGHSHWHVTGILRFELRQAAAPDAVVVSTKQGLCLGDRYSIAGDMPGKPAKPVFTGNCGERAPSLLRLTQGISVGHGDYYRPSLEGQSVDVAGLPEGDYVLVQRVNAARRLRESDYANNASSILIRLTWPEGPEGRPGIRTLAVCGQTESCG